MKFLILIILSFASLSSATVPEWHNHLESLLEKNTNVLERTYGSVKQLEKLKDHLTPNIYQENMNENIKIVSQFIGYKITTEQEMWEVLDYFISPDGGISKAKKSSGLFTFTNVLLIVAVICVVLAAGAVFVQFIVPYLVKMPSAVQITIAYLVAFYIVVVADQFCGEGTKNYVALTGCIAIGSAYVFHLGKIKTGREVNEALLISPVFIVWFILALYFQSKMIGFITVMALQAMLGFAFWVGPLCTWLGFHKNEQIPKAFVSSLALLAVYIGLALGALGSYPEIRKDMAVFDSGVLFMSTFVYFLSLMILSSRRYDDSDSYREESKKSKRMIRINRTLIYNIVGIVSGLASFGLGALSPALGTFRGVGSTFFVFFLLLKWAEIRWGKFWSIGWLGGAGLVYLICLIIKNHPEYFIF